MIPVNCPNGDYGSQSYNKDTYNHIKCILEKEGRALPTDGICSFLKTKEKVAANS
ncbi:hypothetical protein CUZ96_2418 [Enterococcus lactis]|nr:hypothetical protein [Enterococcus lactis]MBL4998080.1 hypothetical protein [Enterococcus lactis]MBL4999889.1 hypothetical protein [Enterococcus lactis]MBL5007017.1 hypothetical protein [Enterococcus lactis]MBL5012751.1 hypothetical protein [Enterococcus lactis]